MKQLQMVRARKRRTMKKAIFTGMGSASNLLKTSMRTSSIAFGALSIASLSGWFSATDLATKTTAYILFEWFSFSALFTFIITFAMGEKVIGGPKLIAFDFLISLFAAIWLLHGLFQTVRYAAKLINVVSTQEFRKDLTGHDYAFSIKTAAVSAGYPITILNPFSDYFVGQIDNHFLIYSHQSRLPCFNSGKTTSATSIVGEARGWMTPLEGAKISLYKDDDGEVTYLDLFGVTTSALSKSEELSASAFITDISMKKSGDVRIEARCVKTTYTKDKMICYVHDRTKSMEFDVSTILLEGGKASVNTGELLGTEMEKLYLESQRYGQARGCGIWKAAAGN